MAEARLQFYYENKDKVIQALQRSFGMEQTMLFIEELVRDPEFNKGSHMLLITEQEKVIKEQAELLEQMDQCKQIDLNRVRCLEEEIKSLNAVLESNSNEIEQYKNADHIQKETIRGLMQDNEELKSRLNGYHSPNTDSLRSTNTAHRESNRYLNSSEQPQQPRDAMSSMETILTKVLAKQTSDEAAKDILPFHGLQSENGDSQAAENFLTFFEELKKYKKHTLSDDKHMFNLLRRKTKGEARKSLDFYNPSTFREAIDLFRDRYINENYSRSLKADLRKMNREINEPVKAYHIRVGKLVETIRKITSHTPPFDEIEAVLLRPFSDEVVNYHGVRLASSNEDFQALIKELEDSYRRKPSLLKPVKPQNKIMVANENVPQIKCSYCKRTNHLAKDCFYLRDRAHGNQPSQQASVQQIYNERVDMSVPPPNYGMEQPFRA